MTVILVLSTFIVFLLIDHFFSKKHAVRIAVQPVAVAPRESVPRLQPSMVPSFWGLAIRTGIRKAISRTSGVAVSLRTAKRR